MPYKSIAAIVFAIAMALGFGGLTAPPANASVDKVDHVDTVQTDITDTTEGSMSWNYCQWFNPNPNGYVISKIRVEVINGNLTVLFFCRYAPYVPISFGPLCRHIGIGNLNDIPGTLFWYPAVPPPSWTCP